MVDHVLREVPVGIKASGTRRERDAVGSIDVPADRYWGAGTQRALRALPGSADSMPQRLFQCYGYVKRAAAMANAQAGRLPMWKAAAIARATDDLVAGLLTDEFPLPIWQSGSGRDADTNVNEVLANRAAQLLGITAGSREAVDAARDVNMGQGLGGTFTASLQIAVVFEIEQALAPRALALGRALDQHHGAGSDQGRRLRAALGRLDEAEGCLHEICIELGEAESAPEPTDDYWQIFIGTIAADTTRPFIIGPDAFSDRGSLDAIVAAMAAVRGVAVVLLDVANAMTVRRETQAGAIVQAQVEALAMVSMHVIGQDQVVAAAAARGAVAASTMRPLIAGSLLKSIGGLAEACEAMRRGLVRLR